MAQIFHRSFNTVSKVSIFGAVFFMAGAGWVLAVVYRSSYVTDVAVDRVQPVPFSHRHHVGELGIDCRYCHTSVETSSFAGLPPTQTCMNCHQQIWFGSAVLEPVRESYRTDQSIPWQRIHNLPKFVYFDHSIHVAKGVGCSTCHGKVSDMAFMRQNSTLLMEWCLECHRQPENYIRPREEIFNMDWDASRYRDPKTGKYENPETGKPFDQAALGARLVDEYHVRSLISCSTCHR